MLEIWRLMRLGETLVGLNEVARLLKLGLAAKPEPPKDVTRLGTLRAGQEVLFGSSEFVVADVYRSQNTVLVLLKGTDRTTWILELGKHCLELQFEAAGYTLRNNVLLYDSSNSRSPRELPPTGRPVQLAQGTIYQAYGQHGQMAVVSKSGIASLSAGLYVITNIRAGSLMSRP